MTDTINIAAIIEKYIAIRDQIDKINAEAKSKSADLKKALDGIEAYMLKLAIDTGQTTFGSADGVAFITTETHCSVADFDQVLAFAREHNMWNLLTKGVSKTVVKEYLDEHSVLPPGINWSAHKVIQIRRK